MKIAALTLLETLCHQCDDMHIEDTYLNCGNYAAYFRAALIYSSPDGRITASTLTDRILIWLLSADTPALTINNTRLALNVQCPTQHNPVTEEACLNLLHSIVNLIPSAAKVTTTDVTEFTTSAAKSTPPSVYSYPLPVSVFFSAGLIAGAMLTAITIFSIMWYVQLIL